jgi:hypothetical protein
MATPARHLCRSLFQVTRTVPVKRKCLSQTQSFASRRPVSHRTLQYRQLSSTACRRADTPRNSGSQNNGDDILDLSKPPAGGYKKPNRPITLADLDADELADYNMLSPRDQVAWLDLQNHYAAEFEEAGIDAFSDPHAELEDPELDKAADDMDRKLNKEMEPVDFPDEVLSRADKRSFWVMDEEADEFTQVPEEDEEWDESAISSIAQNELDLHREIREYTRVMAWDMPLLQSMFLCLSSFNTSY